MKMATGKLEVCLDVGITQTRAWLLEAGRCVAQACTMEGIRSGFVHGSQNEAVAAIDGAVAECLRQAGGDASRVGWLAAAGMVTSELGPYPVAQLEAPAGASELARGIVEQRYRGIVDAPLYLVPGIRFGGAGQAGSYDAIRGEETLMTGLLGVGGLARGGSLLNLGSHWKLIATSDAGQIRESFTGLGGELLFAIARETILKGALPGERPIVVDLAAVRAGVERTRREGLGRALFLTRMDAVREHAGPDVCYWLAAGAVIGDFLPGVVHRLRATVAKGKPWESSAANNAVRIAGFGPLAEAWSACLAEERIPSVMLEAQVVEAAFCAGLRQLVAMREGFRPAGYT